MKEIAEARNLLDFEEEFIECGLKRDIGVCDGYDEYFSWKSSDIHKFERGRLKRERPDLYKEYSRADIRRTFLVL